jgi:hypothetical protein
MSIQSRHKVSFSVSTYHTDLMILIDIWPPVRRTRLSKFGPFLLTLSSGQKKYCKAIKDGFGIARSAQIQHTWLPVRGKLGGINVNLLIF